MYQHERSLVRKMKDKPFVLLGVNSDADRAELKKVLKKERITWRSFYDGQGGPIAQQCAIGAWPTLFLIDHEGVIRKKWEGSPGEDVINDTVKQLVKEAEAASPAGAAAESSAKSSGDSAKS